MEFIAIIPARYASTRFPAKPLALLGGKPIIQHVYEKVNRVFADTYVATDDERIEACVKSFGGRVVMTSAEHRSGTDRVCEAYKNIGAGHDVIVNVQGDEPFIRAEQLEALKRCFADAETQIATLVKPIDSAGESQVLFNPNSPKVVVDRNMNALYFSRSPIPYIRGKEEAEWLGVHTFYKHIGIYAYRANVLDEITKLPQGVLERAESLEQLRWLENGYKIKVGTTGFETIGIDTPEDLCHAEAFLKNNPQ